MRVDIESCARCGEDHHGLDFTRFNRQMDEWTHWALCPTTGEPIELRICEPQPRSKKGEPIICVLDGREYYKTPGGNRFDKATGDMLRSRGLAIFSIEGYLCLIPATPERDATYEECQVVADFLDRCVKSDPSRSPEDSPLTQAAIFLRYVAFGGLGQQKNVHRSNVTAL